MRAEWKLCRSFNTAFGAVAGPTTDYYPQELRREIDDTNALVLRGINNAVNGCGYSITQDAYDEQVALLFASLDALEERLARGRYLCERAGPGWSTPEPGPSARRSDAGPSIP